MKTISYIDINHRTLTTYFQLFCEGHILYEICCSPKRVIYPAYAELWEYEIEIVCDRITAAAIVSAPPCQKDQK